ncbi:MAG: hypothetical protein JNM27_06615 [Leptospirales bacterium]|nr:hypothetical protein [Leptospirales bacterium]
MKNSPHILNTSANLAGICFLVFSSVNALGIGHKSFFDEITAIAMFLFVLSSLLSFLSLRAGSDERASSFEKTADLIFFTGLMILMGLTVFIVISGFVSFT